LAEGIDPPQYVSDYCRTVPDGDPTWQFFLRTHLAAKFSSPAGAATEL